MHLRHVLQIACVVGIPLIATGARADAIFDTYAPKIIATMERQAADTDANKPDCDKIGAALMKHGDEDGALAAELAKAQAKQTPAARQAFNEALNAKYGDRIKAAQIKVQPLMKCTDNATVKAYLAKLDVGAKVAPPPAAAAPAR